MALRMTKSLRMHLSRRNAAIARMISCASGLLPITPGESRHTSRPAQQELSDHMASYWASFIASGAPDGTAPAWSPGKLGEVKILSLSPGHIGSESEFSAEHHCAFWKSLRQK